MRIHSFFSLLACCAGMMLSACGPAEQTAAPSTALLPVTEPLDEAGLALTVSHLETRLQALEDINEIKRLQRIYGYYLDRSDWDNVVDLMTEDAVAEYALGGRYYGRERIRELLYGIGYGEHGLRPQQLREHIQLQPVITLSADGQSAKGRWRVLGLLGQFGEYARWQTGPYEMQYRKEDGVWKISALHWVETFTVPYEGGWRSRMEVTNVADRPMPESDAPASFDYEPWPAVTLFPFHFESPLNATTAAADDEQVLSPPPDWRARLERARQRAQLLQDQHEIEILQRTYGYYVDKNLWDEAADLFAEDGTLEIGGRGIFVGRERAREYLHWLGEPVHGRLYDHTQMQPVVHVAADGMTAKGRWRALVFGGDEGRSSIFGDVIYENEYKKVDGEWQIARLHAWFLMYTMMDQGWAEMGWPNTRPEEDLPPDLPPTEVYDMYPGELTAPLHYDNPVTDPRSAEPQVALGDVDEPLLALSLLQETVTLLEDVQAIERLQNIYGYYFDKWQWDEAAALFAEDGSLEHGLRGVYRGQERVRQALDLYGEAGLKQGRVNNNFIYQPVIHVDGDTANARFRTLHMWGEYDISAQLGGSVNQNTYVKEEGVWKISSDHQFTTFIADYDQGWSHGAMPAPGMSDILPPDEPPSMTYEAFPTFYLIPFHYNNPVSGHPPLRNAVVPE